MDERTYGFSKDDATELVNLISSAESWYSEVRPRGKGGAGIRTGIVREALGCGLYRIELGNFEGSVADIASASGSIGCSPCANVTSAGTEDCGIILSDPASLVVGTGEIVTAYDSASITIPLVVGTDCVLALASGAGVGSGSESFAASFDEVSSASVSGSEGVVWQVLRGYQNHIVDYKERWDCCEPNGPATLIAKTPIIFIGIACEEIQCGACPSGSEV
jgi:hypothetical protein